jgi:hypothetical protein
MYNETHLSQSLWPTDLSGGGALWTSLYPMQMYKLKLIFILFESLCFFNCLKVIIKNHLLHYY